MTKLFLNKLLLISIALIYLSNDVVAHRILGIFIHKINSHFDAFYPIMNGLAENGHNVTVLSFFPNKNNNHSNYHEIILNYPVNQSIDRSQIQTHHTADRSENIISYLFEMYHLKKIGEKTCELTLNSTMIDTVLERHKSEAYDLVITELFITDCMLGVIANMSVPFIGISSCSFLNWHYDKVSQPLFPSYIPSISLGYTEHMTYWQRVINWIGVVGTNMIWYYGRHNENYLLREKFGSHLPDIHEIGKNISLVLVNQHYSLRISQPIVPKVVEIGGIHIGDEKPLPENLKKILDNATDGAIVISWGSILKSSTITSAKRIAIANALAKLNQTIIWKWESDIFPDKPKNIFLEKWLPQRDVLCHPNVKLFWSHGGNLGTSEAVFCGIPIITTPIFGDQFGNSAALSYRQINSMLLYDSITEESVFYVISIMLQPSYLERARRISYIYQNRINSPKATALWWIEHVLATGGNNDLANSYSVNISWFVYYSLDVVSALFAVLWLMLVVIYAAIKFCWMMFLWLWKKTYKKMKQL